ncbi:histone-lysine N-methyltransferase 2D-like [Notolabrus celidotus]|uniref:histone-lysine N-methyltransferase 2D-like n=1 Tax=Notolabrus celidotus TaxID=1203425 RepID=UPI00148F7629|nr:histone-lysine N-methyltransferase 2D-like [Notolabrus celidotus]
MDRQQSLQEAASTTSSQSKHTFFLAEEVPLPESPTPGALSLSPQPGEVPLSLNLPPLPTEEQCIQLHNAGFLSLDEEVAFFMSQEINFRASKVPLPPSPDELDINSSNEEVYPDLKSIRFPYLDDEDDESLDNEVAALFSQPQRKMPWEFSLPPSTAKTDKDPQAGDITQSESRGMSMFRAIQEKHALMPPHLLASTTSSQSKYYHITFFLAEEVQLPESPTPGALTLSPLPDEVPCPPNLPPLPTEEQCIHLHNEGFLSLDEEVAFFMAQEINIRASKVPLPPSPDELDMTSSNEEVYPDLRNTGFPSLDDEDDESVPCLFPGLEEEPDLMPLHLLADIVPNYPDLRHIGFPHLDEDNDPSLDDEVAALFSQPHGKMALEVLLPPSLETVQPELQDVPKSKNVGSSCKPMNLLSDIYLPSAPPPVNAPLDPKTNEKRYPDLESIRFSTLDDHTSMKIPVFPEVLPQRAIHSLDRDTVPKLQWLMPQENLQPPSAPLVQVVPTKGHSHKNKWTTSKRRTLRRGF